jgi:hypothetical protein
MHTRITLTLTDHGRDLGLRYHRTYTHTRTTMSESQAQLKNHTHTDANRQNPGSDTRLALVFTPTDHSADRGDRGHLVLCGVRLSRAQRHCRSTKHHIKRQNTHRVDKLGEHKMHARMINNMSALTDHDH